MTSSQVESPGLSGSRSGAGHDTTSPFDAGSTSATGVARRTARLLGSVPVICAVVATGSVVVLGGWATGGLRLQRAWPSMFVMKTNTAIGLLLRAVALWEIWRNSRRSGLTVWVCLVLGFVLSAATLSEFLFHVDLHVDQLLFVDHAHTVFPGRTAPGTSVCMLVLCVAMMLTHQRRAVRLSQLLLFLAAALPLSAFGGYLYHAPGMSAATPLPIIALHTAIFQLLLCLGTLFVRPDAGLMRVIVSDSLAGASARKLLPSAFVLPMAGGLLTVLGTNLGLYSTQFGSALLVSFCALLFAAAVWSSESLLWKTEKTRALAEARLGEGEQRLRVAISTAKLGTWEFEPVSGRLECSAEFKSAYGFSADVGVTYQLLVDSIEEEDRPRVLDAIDRSIRERIDFEADYRVRRPDGSRRWIVASGRVVPGFDDRATRLVGVTLDVTDRRRAEQTLRDSEQRIRHLADAMPQIVWATNAAGVTEYVNRRWTEYTGSDAAAPPAADWTSLVHPNDQPASAADWAESLQSGREHVGESRLRRSDGAYRWFLVRAIPVRDEAGRVVRWFGTCTDFEDVKQLETQRETLLDAERAARVEAERVGQLKDEFLATLSHELRTPLNAILGWAQLLEVDRPDAQDMAEGLPAIARNARAQKQIIEDLLDMSRIISGKLRLDVRQVELADVIRAAVETVRLAADAKGVRLQCVLDERPATMSGDPNRLQQVLWNLLSNAIRFTPAGGQVLVRLRHAGAVVHLSVADSGEGIKPEFLPYVFDRFRQADGSTTRRHGGLGLGLAIVKQLVELHGGSVHVESSGAGAGATFVIDLPIAAAEAPVAGDRPPGTGAVALPATRPLAGIRILVVDDEPDARSLVRRLLETELATVVLAADADEAMAKIEREPFDVLLSDIGMPVTDGYQLVARLRALESAERTARLPAVALTAYAHATDRRNALDAGFDAHVAKPVEAAQLIEAVAVVTRRVARTIPMATEEAGA